MAWHVVLQVHSLEHGQLHASSSGTMMTGDNPAEIVPRLRRGMERSLVERQPFVDWSQGRVGSLFAVWRFEEKIPLKQARGQVTARQPDYLLMIASNHNWKDLVRLLLPPGVDLFAWERQSGREGG